MAQLRLLLALTLVLLAVLAGMAVTPPLISYQGKLTKADGTPLPDGPYTLRFAIYDVPTGGDPLWSERNTAVQVKKGLFSVMLGSVVNLPANIFDAPNRFFGVKVGDDAEMTPRQQIATVPYAIHAAGADTAQEAKSVVAGAVGTAQIADGAVTSTKLANDITLPGTLTANALAGPWDKSANGYLRIGDMQICWGLNGWGGQGVRDETENVTFPMPFVGIPSVTITPQWANVIDRYGIWANSVTDKQGAGFTSFAKITSDGAGSIGYHWIAIGRWR